VKEPVWVSGTEAVNINALLVGRFGGIGGGPRDENLVKAALARPLNKWHYDNPRPDLFTLAAAYAFGIARGHVFHDGNKRTGYVVAITFLAVNSVTCAPDPAAIVRQMEALAGGDISEDAFADWLRGSIAP